jgi:Ala-tRNA(Pro) deacylase
MANQPPSKYHPVVSQIVKLLKGDGCWFETFEHKPVRTSEEAAKIRTGYSLRQGTKAIIIRVKVSNSEKRFAMLVIPGDSRFDIKKIKQLFGAKDVRLATEEEIFDLTKGVLPGGIPPFGNLFGIDVVADPSIFKNKKIVFNAGDRSFSIGMRSEDYKRLVKPQVEPIVTMK